MHQTWSSWVEPHGVNMLWIIMVDSPKWVDLTGFLHGYPGADETGDQTAGQRKERGGGGGGVMAGKEKSEIDGGGRTDERGREKESVRDRWQTKETNTTQRSAKVHLLFIHHLRNHFSWGGNRKHTSASSAQLLITLIYDSSLIKTVVWYKQ